MATHPRSDRVLSAAPSAAAPPPSPPVRPSRRRPRPPADRAGGHGERIPPDRSRPVRLRRRAREAGVRQPGPRRHAITVVFIVMLLAMVLIFAPDRGRRAPEPPGDRPVTPDEFRASGHELIDWIADYLEIGRASSRVQPAVAPGDVRAPLPEHPPTAAEPFAAVLADLDASSCRASRTGSTRASSPTSRRTRRTRRSSASCCPPDSACRA